MNAKIICCLIALTGALILSAKDGYSFGSFGTTVNNTCAPATPYTGNCALCHLSDRSASTPAKTAFSGGSASIINYFCPPAPTPTCTDNDNDTFALEGGDCGPVDCSDNDAAINPGAVENCSDGFDNNCNGLVDDQDPGAVGCQVCTDNDGDGYALEGGGCGPVDCDDSNGGINPGAADVPNNGLDENCDGADSVDLSILDNDGDGFTPATGDCDDTDGAVHPNAVEICTDGLDNDCNNLIDSQDPAAVECPQTCLDSDGDTYAVDGGGCGPVDCDDADALINPGASETCGDGMDNDCDGSIDEGCDTSCQDADNDSYQDAACGGTDCNDSDAAINPGAAEIPGNGIDENCNGTSDDVVLTCPDGTLLVIRNVEYDRRSGKLTVSGRASVGTTITIADAVSGTILAEGIGVRDGKWRVTIKNVSRSLQKIIAMTSNGCSTEKTIGTWGDRDHDDRDDHDDHDDD